MLVSEPLGPEHLDIVAPWEADERVARWLWPAHLGGPRTRKQTAAGLADTPYRLWRLPDGTPVARGGLAPAKVLGEEVTELGWLVDPDRWGQGLATQLGRQSVDHARDVLGLEQVVAFTLVDNRASRRVMAKLGMAYELDFEHAGLPHALYKLRCF